MKWECCDLVYIGVLNLFETCMGKWVGYTVREWIWEPLAMDDTFFSLSDAEAATYTGRASLARGYSWLNRTREYPSVPYVNSDVVSGAGVTVSNVLDYAKWLRCLMGGAPLLSVAAHDALGFPRINLAPYLSPHKQDSRVTTDRCVIRCRKPSFEWVKTER